MGSAGQRAFEFAPLRGFDAADTEEAFHNVVEASEGAIEESNVGNRQGLPRAAWWSLCATTSIYTTKRLMINHGFHYPLAIAFRTFIVLSILYVFVLRMGSESARSRSSPRKVLQWGLRKPGGDDFLMNKYWVGMIPASVAAAASVPMFLEGILHMPSLPVLVMVLPLIYAAESLVLFTCCSPSHSQKWLPWETLLITASSGVVLYNEYRLMVPGLIWGVLGILLVGFSRGLFIIGSERAGPHIAIQAKLKANHGFVIMTLLFGLLFSGISGFYLEHIESIYKTGNGTLSLMALNIASSVGACFAGTSFLVYSPISFNDPTEHFSTFPVHGIELMASFASSIVIFLQSVYLAQFTVISSIQIVAFLLSVAAAFGFEHIHAQILGWIDSTKRALPKLIPTERKSPSKILSAVATLFLILISSSALSYMVGSTISAIPHPLPSALDESFRPVSPFDIVVSMYNEDPKYVKKTLDAIKSTTMLSKFTPTVIIYTKNVNADLYELKVATGADIVERMENLGREGATYLQHIVDKWDNLAEQTMFIQAHAHNMRELIPRINDYLVPRTGMLSLGFTGVVCDCGSCGDRWGWEDKYNAIPQLFNEIYDEPCQPGTPVLLAYKGQFVASARRIRGISRKIYGGLLTTITSKDGWSHNKTIVGDNVDLPDNPYFGFTLERVWSLLMQCATDGGVAAKCPSLLSGMRSGGDVGDCQCLDQ